MFLPLYAFIGYRYTRASQASSFVAFINFFSVAGITLGMMSLIIVLSVMNGFEAQLKQRVLGIMPHITVDASIDNITLQKLVDVKVAMPFKEAEGVLQTRAELRGVAIQGVDPNIMTEHSIVSDKMLVGQFGDLADRSFNLIIGRALASQLNVRPGDQVRLLVAGASVYTPLGRIPSQRIVNIAGIFDLGSALDDKTVFMAVTDLQRLLRSKDTETDTRLVLNDAFKYQLTAQQLVADNLQFTTWRERQGPLFDAVKMEKNMLFLLLVLVIAVAAFNIISALVMVVNEKQSDIAILMTLGMQRQKIMQIFLFNGLFNGLKGAVIGTVLGVLTVWQLNTILSLLNIAPGFTETGGLPIDMRLEQIVGVALFAMLLCFLATLYPAYKALNIQPARALQYE
jgi:lipoprotein-releasing system permease protein